MTVAGRYLFYFPSWPLLHIPILVLCTDIWTEQVLQYCIYVILKYIIFKNKPYNFNKAPRLMIYFKIG